MLTRCVRAVVGTADAEDVTQRLMLTVDIKPG
jgi:hypothetical protein